MMSTRSARWMAVALAVAAGALGGCDRRATDAATTPSTTTMTPAPAPAPAPPVPAPPASAASR